MCSYWNFYIGSGCSVYSRKNKKWFDGKIINIFINQKTNQEWLVIEYNKKIKKQIQRFSEFIKPSDFECNDNNNNYEIIKLIYNKLKQNETNEIFIDMKIFKENKNECSVEEAKEGEIICSCTSLTRVCEALHYYKMTSSLRENRLISVLLFQTIKLETISVYIRSTISNEKNTGIKFH